MYDTVDLVLLCRMLSAQYKIEIRPQACSATNERVQAWCRKDNDRYVLQVPFAPHMDDMQWRHLRGYIDHECGHIKFSDFMEYEAMQNRLVQRCVSAHPYLRKGQPLLDKVTGMTVNVLEDVRIERLMGIDFPGARTNLNNLSEHLFKDCDSVDRMMGKNMSGRL